MGGGSQLLRLSGSASLKLESRHRGRVVTNPRPLLKSPSWSSTLRVQASGARRREDGRPQGRDARLAGGLVYDSRARRATPSIPAGGIRKGYPKSSPSLGFGDRPIRDKGCRQTPDLTRCLDNIRIIRRQRHIREVVPDRARDEPSVQLGGGNVWPSGRHVLQVEIHKLRDAPDLTLPDILIYAVARVHGASGME